MTPEKLKETFAKLPNKPGVYKYFNGEQQIIYVGKAKSLKKRVASYFNKIKHENFKTSVLVSKIEHIDFTVVDTEMDALLLENSLIKEFQPRYNINLKDDKSYPFIRISTDRFPKVYAMRNPVKDGSEYFGPYASPKVMYMVLDLVKKLYPTRNCNLLLSQKNIESGKFKICLEYQIGNCKGPCEGLQDEASYMDSIRNIKHLLRGNLAEVRRHLKQQMQECAGQLKFELAQGYKEKLDMLDRYQHRSTVVSQSVGDVEVYSISSTDKYSFINFLRVSNGLIISTQNLEMRKKLDESDSEMLEMAVGEMRATFGLDFREIILPFPIELEDKGIKFTIPKAGEKKSLLDLSMKNAMLFMREKLDQYDKLNPDVRIDRLMEVMKNDLRLQEYPYHIECFDNSNFQGAYPVSACVVFRNGKAFKKDYRIFNVKTVEGIDDFATMQEVITRRYNRMIAEETPLPQLIVVDGGKGQLSAAVESLKVLNLYGKIAIIGIAKRLEEIYYPGDPLPMYIDKKSETLKIIQQMRDEAHRFGITAHRNRRDKGTLKTGLTEIKGVGKETADMLLKHFRSFKKVETASEEEIAAVVGMAKAKIVSVYFAKMKSEN